MLELLTYRIPSLGQFFSCRHRFRSPALTRVSRPEVLPGGSGRRSTSSGAFWASPAHLSRDGLSCGMMRRHLANRVLAYATVCRIVPLAQLHAPRLTQRAQHWHMGRHAHRSTVPCADNWVD